MPADLGILVLTMARRRPFFDRLKARFEPQLSERAVMFSMEVEPKDAGGLTIGENRQKLLTSPMVDSRFVCFFDDDDVPSDDFVSSILDAIEAEPDAGVVGFRTKYYEDGYLAGEGVLTQSARCWTTEKTSTGGILHVRMPNHLSPVKREIALAVGYLPMQSGEDADYSYRMRKMYPQLQEAFVDKCLYHYLYRNPRKRDETQDVQLAATPC